MIELGDIVKRNVDSDDAIYIVVDIIDYSNKKKVDIDYEIAQVFPILNKTKYITVRNNDIFLHNKNDSKNKDMLMDYVFKQRAKRGWENIPDYLVAIEENQKSIGVDKAKTKKYDTIEYNLIQSVDECLEAINHLNVLYEMFGDEAYLQLKDVVIERIKKLMC